MTQLTGHILEVLCSLKFDPTKNDWDATYYGKYYDQIFKLGYTEKKEKKEVKLQVDVTGKNPSHSQQEVRGFIFRNESTKSAIMIGPHFISFHKLAPYNNWDDLMDNILEPGFHIYKKLGLGNSLREVQCTYINNMKLEEGQKGVFDKFKIFEPPANAQESGIHFQGNYDLASNTKAVIRLNWNKVSQPGQKGIFFECSTFVKSESNSEYRKLAKDAHDAANLLYGQIKK